MPDYDSYKYNLHLEPLAEAQAVARQPRTTKLPYEDIWQLYDSAKNSRCSGQIELFLLNSVGIGNFPIVDPAIFPHCVYARL